MQCLITAALVAALALGGLTACGSETSDADAAEAAMERFVKARAEDDHRTVCRLLTRAARDRMIARYGAAGETCEQASQQIADLLTDRHTAILRAIDVEHVQVRGTRAAIRVEDLGLPAAKGTTTDFKPVVLLYQDGRWMIDSYR